MCLLLIGANNVNVGGIMFNAKISSLNCNKFALFFVSECCVVNDV